MKSKKPVPYEKKTANHSNTKHMWMMAICCVIPIAGFIAIASAGMSLLSLETFLLLLCPLGMMGMMYMMHRDGQKNSQSHSCCTSEQEESLSPGKIEGDSNSSPSGSFQHGSLKT